MNFMGSGFLIFEVVLGFNIVILNVGILFWLLIFIVG